MPLVLTRYEAAEQEYRRYKAHLADGQAVAIDMRTLLDGVKGQLWVGTGSSDWSTMADRLVPSAIDPLGNSQLKKQDDVRRRLTDGLTNVSKQRVEGAHVSVDDAWTALLEHLFAVLSAVNSHKANGRWSTISSVGTSRP